MQGACTGPVRCVYDQRGRARGPTLPAHRPGPAGNLLGDEAVSDNEARPCPLHGNSRAALALIDSMAADGPPDAPGFRVFVAEDEVLIALVIQDILEELGHSIVGPAARVEDALQTAREGSFDFAILDVKLADSEVYPVAEILAARGIPFAFATGYGQDSLAAAFRSRPVLSKPYTMPDVAAIIRHISGGLRAD